MFFDDEVLTPRKRAHLAALPPVPGNGWRPPTEFPNLSAAVALSLDVETEETDFDYGPGWGRGKGEIVGLAIGARDAAGNRGKWYFPVRHKVERQDNLDPVSVFAWARSVLASPVPKIGANLIYDVGWLTTEGVDVRGVLYDVQFAEALLDEQGETNLDFLAGKYIGGGKTTLALYEWLAQAYGGKANSQQRANIWRAPPRLVGPYGEDDADLPLTILERQWPHLEAENLVDLFKLECKLIPLLVRMRNAGVTVDRSAAEQLHDELGRDIIALNDRLAADYGMRVNVNSGDDLAKLFRAVGLDFPKTAQGAPSFRKEFLKGLSDPVGKLVNEIREYEKIRGTFVRSYILERSKPVAGSNSLATIHCSFHPLRGDSGGAKTGRFASSDPNLQNIPVRTKLGKRVREAFVPDLGHTRWRKFDYSQIEYRMLAHFATGTKPEEIAAADALRQSYVDNPKTDYHNKVYEMVCPLMGWNFNDPDEDLRATRRKPIKNVNFGLLYGQSEKDLAYKAGFTPKQAGEFFKAYHAAAPYCRATMRAITDEVQVFGFVRTILGRRTRFNMWEPRSERGGPVPYDVALKYYGHDIMRAYAYRGTNYKFQGSAADVIKAAMVRALDDGVFDVIGVPKLQVHDELDFSEIDLSPEQTEGFRHLQQILEKTTPCRVPIVADTGFGPDWGSIN